MKQYSIGVLYCPYSLVAPSNLMKFNKKKESIHSTKETKMNQHKITPS